MGVIDLSADKPTPGTSGDANQVANGFTALETLLNGNIDRQNIANGIIGARTSTTVAGLGTLYNGDVVYIRAGSTPYDFVELVYDSTYGKPVSQPWVVHAFANGPVATAGTTYAAVDPLTWVAPAPWFPWRTLDTAGLKLQLRVVAILDAGASSSVEVAAAAVTADAGGTVSVDTTNVSASVTHNTGTQTLKDSGWAQINASVTVKDFVGFEFALKRTGANNGNLRYRSSILARWAT